MRDQLLGSTQPVLSISLEPGERIIAETGEFAWMTDSIRMTAGPAGLSDYTATSQPGTVAFASRLPGSIVSIEVTPGQEYLVHRNGFLAGTPGIELATGFRQSLGAAPEEEVAEATADEFILRRIGGHGRAWVELAGDVVTRELAAGTSLRTHPWHIGISEGSVAVQMAAVPASKTPGSDSQYFAVLSGPGTVWLQSMQLLAAQNFATPNFAAPNLAPPNRRLAAGPAPARANPAVEGAAGLAAPG
ncbi:MAG TPA: AIM24 family protein [Streptosporangiaceae bacterium]|nr:AIM24 family protein [Streptosporangiaceae bacterium]